MPSPVVKKALVGAAGVTGAGLLAWRTQFPWIKYDLQMMKMGKKIMAAIQADPMCFAVDKFEALVATQPKKTMVIFEDLHFTYEFIDQQANRVAGVMRRLGIQVGDAVAMMMHNDPAFVWTFLGLQKVGVTAALINYNLKAKQLAFSITSAEPKALILGAGEDLLHSVSEVLSDLQALPVLLQGVTQGSLMPAEGLQDMDSMMRETLPVRPDPTIRSAVTPNSVAAYIYTSGTTGLPKPVLIRQYRLRMYIFVTELLEISPSDIMYTVVPLYHVAGLGFSFMGMLNKGSTIVLRKKFSASNFWSDCRKHNVTLIQYIGELFRYLLAQPKNDLDGVHKVRAAMGVGLRKDIFLEVQKRFRIPRICEVFGATEGVSGLFNLAGRPGAIGRMSPLLEFLNPNPSVLVKCDYSSAMPIRDKNGRCIRVKRGEPGLFLSQVPKEVLTEGKLVSYKASQEANDKKLVRDVLKNGDLFFNYGDVFYVDSDYFVYFHDRIGDTFRWKGENVSTTEVANILSSPDFIQDANVYGVSVPGHDGRAGMVALTLNEATHITPDQLKRVYQVCQDNLPSYARPLFLRILPEAIVTGTFKQRKVELVEQGYDFDKVKDDLYYLDAKAKTYSPLTPEGLVSFLQSRL